MKKFLFLLLAFAVAGATMSCEKSEIVEQNKENNELTPGSENKTNSETDDKANSEVDVKMLIGKWTQSLNILLLEVRHLNCVRIYIVNIHTCYRSHSYSERCYLFCCEFHNRYVCLLLLRR